MSISKLIEQAAEAGVYLHLVDGKLRYKLTVETFPLQLKAQISAAKDEIIALLAAKAQPQRRKITAQSDKAERIPASFAQQRLWFTDSLQGSSREYHMPQALAFDSGFNVEIAQQALSAIVKRHQVLRTTFYYQDQQLWQRVNPAQDFVIERWSTAQTELSQLMQQHADWGFDLSRDLMLRAAFVEQAGGDDVLLLNIHHIACDAWSMGILVKEFISLYQAIGAKGSSEQNIEPCPVLAPLEIQYGDFALWQRQYVCGEVLEKQLNYWHQQLAGLPAVHQLPLDGVRHNDGSGAKDNQHIQHSVSFKLSKPLVQDCLACAQRYQLTPFMFLHGALSLLLSRYCDSDDIVIGTPVANRLQTEVQPLIGFFVNTLVLRSDCDQGTVKQFFAHIREVNLQAQANQDVGFDQLVELLQVERQRDVHPLFQIILALSSSFDHVVNPASGATEQTAIDKPSDLTFRRLSSGQSEAKFELDVSARLDANGGAIAFNYDSSLFSRQRIQDLARLFEKMLQALASAGEDMPLDDLAFLGDEALHIGQCLPLTIEQPALLHHGFERQVALRPEAPAVVFGQQRLSYLELNQRANQIARDLIAKGCQADTVVAICCERSEHMLVAMLAVLKAGGCYLPLDFDLPDGRIALMLDDADCQLVVCQQSLLPRFDNWQQQQASASKSAQLIDLNGDFSSYDDTNIDASQQPLTANNLAYVIYTSGSSGTPKGVLIEHQAVAAHIDIWADYLELTPQDHIIQFASMSFDGAVESIFSALYAGACLFIRPQQLWTAPGFYQFCIEHQITLADLPPGYCLQLLTQLDDTAKQFWQQPTLRTLVLGGDALNREILASWQQLKPPCRLINAYGPTEAVVTASCFELIDHDADKPIPIGTALPLRQLLVLDSKQRLMPIGAVGELYIGGDCLARGYLNRKAQTDEAFIANPYAVNSDSRLYRTKDRVQWQNGVLNFFGRVDNQVKVRGFRVELDEIQQVLLQADVVESAVVVIKTDASGQNLLVAYVQCYNAGANDDLSGQLHAHLAKLLPSYMIPSLFVEVKQWPLTLQGKIDIRALPEVDLSALQGQFVGAKNPIEQRLVSIWADLLEIEATSLSTETDFFVIGGHSLLLIRLHSEIEQAFAINITLQQLYGAATIAAQGRLVAETEAQIQSQALAADHSDSTTSGASNLQGKNAAIVPAVANQAGGYPLSFAQQRMWFLHRYQRGKSGYNLSLNLQVSGQFQPALFEQVMIKLIEHHQILRTLLVIEGSEVYQRPLSQWQFALTQKKLTTAEQISRAIDVNTSANFDLTTQLPVRGLFIELAANDSGIAGQQQGILSICIDHIAADGWSMGLLLNQFVDIYQKLKHGKPVSLSPSLQYQDYASWQRQAFADGRLQHQVSYWQQQLADAPAIHGLPLAYPRKQDNPHHGGELKSQLPAIKARQLKALASQLGLSDFMLLHGVLALLLSRYGNSDDIVIGTPVANRLRPELMDVVGLFVNTLVLRTNTNYAQVADYFAHIKQVNLAAQAHQDLPFEQLVELLEVERSTLHHPVFQVLLGMNNTGDSSKRIEGIAFRSLEQSQYGESANNRLTAKFELNLNVQLDDSGLWLSWVYDKGLFSPNQIESFNRHYLALLECLISDKPQQLSQWRMLSVQELAHLGYGVADHAKTPIGTEPQGQHHDYLLHQYVEQIAARQPQQVAIIEQGQTTDYAELNHEANQLARYLQLQGINGADVVAISAPRSKELLVAMLAIVKVGAVYVMLDESAPAERLLWQLADAKVKLLLIDSDKIAALATELPLIELSQPQWLMFDGSNLAALENHGDNLAYICYTSGSTGLPKGVLVSHKNVTQLVCDPQVIDWQSDDVLAYCANPVFDATTWEVWSGLCNGASVLIVGQQQLLDAQGFADFISANRVTIVQLTAGILAQFVESAEQHILPAFARLRYLLFGGDKADIHCVRKIAERGKPQHLVHTYGPTETVAFTLTQLVDAELLEQHILPLGKALSNSHCYVLDQQLSPVPVGSIGQLYIGGDGVALGYLNREALSASHFINDSYISDNQRPGKMYKTGDLVRLLSNGAVEFIGRNDSQVKIRGFRVELGELQQQLEQHPLVASSVAMVREDGAGEKQLVGYVVADSTQAGSSEISGEQIQAWLSERLPHYLQPQAVVVMAQFTLTANGKVDRRALPDLADIGGTDSEGQYFAPSSINEQQLQLIWAELLNLAPDQISVEADFFALGGHSLLVMQLVTRIQQQFDLELAVFQVFEAPTIKGLAELIATAVGAQRSLSGGMDLSDYIERYGGADEADLTPLSFAQQRLWFNHQRKGSSSEYNMPSAYLVYGPFNLTVANQAINQLIERHRVLRTVYPLVEGQPQAQVLSDAQFSFEWIDLAGLSGDEQQRQVEQIQRQDSHRSFDLSSELLIRGTYLSFGLSSGLGSGVDGEQYRVAENQAVGVLLFNIHHIGADGWTMRLVFNEFIALYRSISDGVGHGLPQPFQYADFSRWQRQQLDSDSLEQQLDFWQQYLDEAPGTHSLPLEGKRQTGIRQGAAVNQVLPRTISDGLKSQLSDSHCTLFMWLQAAFALHLGRLSFETDVVLGSPDAGRSDKATESMVGLFLYTRIYRSQFGDNPDWWSLLARTREDHLTTSPYAQVPFEAVVERMNPSREAGLTPIFQVLINYLPPQNKANEPQLKGVAFSHIDEKTPDAKYDISLYIHHQGEDIGFKWVYDTELFSADTMATYTSEFIHLLGCLVQAPQQRVLDHGWLNGRRWLPIANKVDAQLSIAQRLAAHAKLQPQAMALSFEHDQISQAQSNLVTGQSYTYLALNQQVNRLANWLAQQQGVSASDNNRNTVAIDLPRDCQRVIAILAVLKLGGCYVPLSAELPAARVDYMLQVANPHVVLTQDLLIRYASEIADCSAEEPADVNAVGEVSAHAAAHIIFTSGSTGKPKGVVGTYGATLNRIDWMLSELPFAVGESCAHITSMAFIRGVWELLVPLCAGAHLRLCPRQIVRQPDRLWQWLHQHQIERMVTAPSLLTALTEVAQRQGNIDQLRLQHWFVSGEPLLNHHAQALLTLKPDLALYNLYGSTEVMSDVLWHQVSAADTQAKVPVGRPICGVDVMVVGPAGQSVPDGVMGELLVYGHCLAQGYCLAPDGSASQTAETFVDTPQGRGYRSGDLGLVSNQGQVVCFGRMDDQIKIRGYRIELAEITNQLLAQSSVANATVIVTAQQQLLAFVEPLGARQGGEGLSADLSSNISEKLSKDLIAALKLTLPQYMLPQGIHVVAKFPLKPNGKIDKKALLALNINQVNDNGIKAPMTETAKAIAQIWAQLLNRDASEFSVSDSFFDCGGHSLLLLTLIYQLNDSFDCDLGLNDIYVQPHLGQLAAVVDSKKFAAFTPEDQRQQAKSNVAVKLSEHHSKAGGTKLFAFHPLGGRIERFALLAELLGELCGDDCEVYGVQAACYAGVELRFDSILALAAYYAEQIRLVQPQGPYRLAGWSAGGQIAYYVCHVLVEQGHEVDYVALLDPAYSLEKPLNNLAECIEAFFSLSFGADSDIDYQAIGELAVKRDEQEVIPWAVNHAQTLSVEMGQTPSAPHMTELLLKALIDYSLAERPAIFAKPNGLVRLFVCHDRPEQESYIQQWRGGFDCQVDPTIVDGDHQNMIFAPCLDGIAAQIALDLKAVKASESQYHSTLFSVQHPQQQVNEDG